MESAFRRRILVVLLAVFFEGGLAGLAWLLGWLLDRPVLDQLVWTWRGILQGAAACLPLLLAFAYLMRSQAEPIVRIREIFDEVLRPLFSPCSVAELALISILAGLGEELLFRGIFQAEIGERLGAGVGLAVASVLFGLVHAITRAYVVIATLFGVYLGWLWLLTGDLVVPVVAHALYDAVVLLYLLKGGGRRATAAATPSPAATGHARGDEHDALPL